MRCKNKKRAKITLRELRALGNKMFISIEEFLYENIFFSEFQESLLD